MNARKVFNTMFGIFNSFKFVEILLVIANADVIIRLVTIINVLILKKNEWLWLHKMHIIESLSLYMVNRESVILFTLTCDLISFYENDLRFI